LRIDATPNGVERLGISAENYGKLIGVSGVTIYKWEHDTSSPRKAQLVALAAVRGLGNRQAKKRLDQVGKKGTKKKV